ncbi:hypothetical protein [Parasphingorhabdus sp.]|uniref:hypothetical protein n=1 Tax=Parasphingorhabdus sp. TaxID=2709688 RepID=UPI003A95BA19
MSSKTQEIVSRIRDLEVELEKQINLEKERLNQRIAKGGHEFDRDMLRFQKSLRVGIFRYLKRAQILNILTAPFIYALIFPFIFLDLSVTIYQAVCFRAYKIDRVRRSDYLIFDRQKLPYLNLIEKINCTYCSYANGVIAYVREVAARTEQYWCPIKHARRRQGAHARYRLFEEYGDGDNYRSGLAEHRDALNHDQKTE